jgi:NAD(P)-dependent dehydrogenase (short-subunit alcohol dehydrogenase family)
VELEREAVAIIARMVPTSQRVALVTGSSRGLGSDIARRLARDGLAVAVNGLRGDGRALEVVGAIRDEGGVADAFTADVTDERQVDDLVAPGFIPVERHADVSAEIRDAYLASVPAGRMGTREDIAHAVSFFASEGAGFVTGQRLVVDGGRGLGGGRGQP